MRWSKIDTFTNPNNLRETYAQICRKTWVNQSAVKPGTFTRRDFYGFLFFSLNSNCKRHLQSKSRNMCSQIIMHSTKNYFIYLTMRKYKVLQTCRLQTGRSRLVGLQSFSSSTKLHAQKLELQLLFLTRSSSAVCSCVLSEFNWFTKNASSIYRQFENCYSMGRLTCH